MKSKTVTGALSISLILWSFGVQSATLVDHNFGVTAGTEYQSNIALLEDEESVVLRRLDPTYSIVISDGVNEWAGSLGLLLQKSSNSLISADREDPRANINWTHQQESGFIRIGGSYEQQTVRLVQQSLTQGFLGADGTSITKAIDGEWVWNVNNKTIFTLLGDIQKQKFTDDTSFIDFTNRYAQAQITYILNEKIRPFIRASAHKFSSTSQDTVRWQDYKLGAVFLQSDLFSIDAGAGVTHVSDTGDSEFTVDISGAYERARSRASLSYERGIVPTGIGGVVLSNTVSGDYSYELSQKSSFNIGVNYNENTGGGGDFKSQQIVTGYSYDLTPNWILGVTGSYTQFTIVDSKPKNKTVGLFATYQPFTR